MKKPAITLIRSASVCGLALIAMSLTACGSTASYLDPYTKPYSWRPTAAPTANLAAQLVNPQDLVSGRGEPEGDATESSLAIQRVWQDRPKQISTDASGGSGSGSSGSGGSSAAGGGTN